MCNSLVFQEGMLFLYLTSTSRVINGTKEELKDKEEKIKYRSSRKLSMYAKEKWKRGTEQAGEVAKW